MHYPVSPISEATYIYRMSLSAEKAVKRFLMFFVQSPETSPVVSCTSRHNPHLYHCSLIRRQVGTHDTINRFRKRTISPKNKNLVIAFLDQLARQLDGMARKFGHAIRKRRMTLTQQFP